jgi:hypothetical protein
LLVAYPISCTTLDAVTSLDVYPECEHYETIPASPFLAPVTLVQCYSGPSSVSPNVAKKADNFDDPLGTNFEGIEYFAPATASFSPTCAAPPAARAAPGLTHAEAAPPSHDAKDGRSGGAWLQGTLGAKVSAFSDWGFVDVLSATIEGVITNGSDSSPIAGATVDLSCEGDTSPRATTDTVADGTYVFDGAPGGLFLPGDVCEVRASASGLVARSTDDFTVVPGLNTHNLALDALVTGTGSTVEGAVRHTPDGCGPVECSSTLVGGASVVLACVEVGPAHPRSFTDVTVTGADGGSSSYGRYAFLRAVPGFGPGWSCTVSATFGPESGSAGPFDVLTGVNKADLRIF